MSTATPREVVWAESQADYASFETPWEGQATLIRVEDIKANTGNTGWSWVFNVDGLEISAATWHAGKGGWKTTQIATALGYEPVVGSREQFDPNRFAGKPCMVRVERGENGYLSIERCWPIKPDTEDDSGQTDLFSALEESREDYV